jgi:hypothetical protein
MGCWAVIGSPSAIGPFAENLSGLASIATDGGVLSALTLIPCCRLARGVGSLAIIRSDRTGDVVAPLSVDRVLKILTGPQSVPDLRRYFNPDPAPGVPAFSGRRFDSLGPGCPHEDVRNRFTSADLLAVQCLGVTVPIEVGLDLLEGDLGRQMSGLLSEIPTDVALGTGDARSLIEDGREADRAWHLLNEQDDVGWVTAGKLLARKRQRLIPVWDQVVRCALGRPKGAWLWLDELLRAEDAVVQRRLEDLHRQAELPSAVSLLRVLDVVIWMRHRDPHRPSRCRGL